MAPEGVEQVDEARSLMAFAESTPESAFTATELWYSVLTGVITFACARLMWDYYIQIQRSIHLTRLLIFECAGTVNKMTQILGQIDESSEISWSTPEEVGRYYNGFVVSLPSPLPMDLVQTVDPESASLIGYFYDRWSRFNEFEKRYANSYQKYLDLVTTQHYSSKGDMTEITWLFDEYRSQVQESLESLKAIAVELCFFSCKIFSSRFSASHLGRNFSPIQQYSNGRWKNWGDFQKDQEHFYTLREA